MILSTKGIRYRGYSEIIYPPPSSFHALISLEWSVAPSPAIAGPGPGQNLRRIGRYLTLSTFLVFVQPFFDLQGHPSKVRSSVLLEEDARDDVPKNAKNA